MRFHSYISRRFPGLPGKIRAYIDLIRPFTLLAPFIGCIAFGLFALIVDTGQELGWSSARLMVYGAITLVLVNCASNVWNQAWEVEVDRINKPDRPIPSGRVEKDEAVVLAGFLYIIAMARGFTINHWFAGGTLLLVLITIAYSHERFFYLKGKFIVNNLTMSLARGYLGPWTAWCLFGDPFSPVIHAACLILAIWTFGAICTKDIPDMEGDRSNGIRTFPVVVGLKGTRRVVAVMILVPFVLVYPFIRWGALIPGMIWFLVLAPFSLAIIYLLYSGKDVESIVENRVSWVLMYIQFNAMLLSFPLIYLLA